MLKQNTRGVPGYSVYGKLPYSTTNKSNSPVWNGAGLVAFEYRDQRKPWLRTAISPNFKFDAIISCAACYTGHTKGDTPKTDTEGYRNLVDATKEAGITT